MSKDFDAQALFWGGLLYPALYPAPDEERSINQILLELSRQKHPTPEGWSRTYSLSTFKRKFRRFENQGIEGLKPQLRKDYRQIRGNRAKELERAIEIKRENPFRSPSTVNLILRGEDYQPIPASTLMRHFNQQGVTVRKLGYESTIIRKRWSREHTHSLWVGDFSQGPWILDETGQSHKTWISAFIDVHSRFVVVGIYALTSDMDALVRSLLAAFELHGKPKALYLDNAKVYSSPVLERACLNLSIELIHRTVRDPQGGGIIERFFLTLQKQFESELLGQNKTPLSLAKLNELFKAWCSQVYHKNRHSEIHQTPEQRYTEGLLHPVVPLAAHEAQRSFFNQVKRRVHKDFCDIAIHTQFYRVSEKLRGDNLLVRYSLGGLGEMVELYSLDARQRLGEGQRHDRSQRILPQPPPVFPETTDYVAILEKLQKQADQDAMPHQTPRYRPWDAATFVTKICAISNTSVNDLSSEDIQALMRLHQQCPDLGQTKLRLTWKQCQPQTLNQLLIELGK
jgi:transposase InsO family protein